MTSFVLLAMFFCFGQTPAPAPTQPASAAQTSSAMAGPQVIGHGSFPVKVTKALDSSKLKPGDVVELKAAGTFILPNGTRVPEGAKVTGHITEAKARSKGDSQSELTVVFDQISLANGKQVTIRGIIQAVGSNPNEDAPNLASGPTMSKNGGAGWTPSDIKSGSNNQVAATESATVSPGSTGVHGIRGLQLRPDGVLASDGKLVKLDSGVRIIVRSEILE